MIGNINLNGYSNNYSTNVPKPYMTPLEEKNTEEFKETALGNKETSMPAATEERKIGTEVIAETTTEAETTFSVFVGGGIAEGESDLPSEETKELETAKITELASGFKYVVRRGDSYWGISQKMYGTGTKASEIAGNNNRTIHDKLHVGEVLVIK